METGLEKQLEKIRENIRRLKEEQTGLREEIRYYQAENSQLKASLDRLTGEGKNFTLPPENRNIATEKESYSGKFATVVRQIDFCVEEIDRCIARLNVS
jgi:predicted RNase H-like nuclease (RuvC/YqgF family)